MATLTLVPASGSITATRTAVRVTVAGADQNDLAAFDEDETPSSPEIRYYLLFENPAGDDGRSYEFGVNADGEHEFNSYIFPNDGSWTVRFRTSDDDNDVATSSVTVAAV